jgi:hypothetical protein
MCFGFVVTGSRLTRPFHSRAWTWFVDYNFRCFDLLDFHSVAYGRLGEAMHVSLVFCVVASRTSRRLSAPICAGLMVS